MLGILCATPEELLALREVLRVPPEPQVHGPTRIWLGDGLVLAQCGIGKVNAAAAATRSGKFPAARRAMPPPMQ